MYFRETIHLNTKIHSKILDTRDLPNSDNHRTKYLDNKIDQYISEQYITQKATLGNRGRLASAAISTRDTSTPPSRSSPVSNPKTFPPAPAAGRRLLGDGSSSALGRVLADSCAKVRRRLRMTILDPGHCCRRWIYFGVRRSV